MFGLSFWELAVIAIVIIFVVGPNKLPEVAKNIGKTYGNFKRTFNEMKQTVNIDDDYINKKSNKTTVSHDDRMKSYSAEFKSQWEEKTASLEEPVVKKSIIENNSENNKG